MPVLKIVLTGMYLASFSRNIFDTEKQFLNKKSKRMCCLGRKNTDGRGTYGSACGI